MAISSIIPDAQHFIDLPPDERAWVLITEAGGPNAKDLHLGNLLNPNAHRVVDGYPGKFHDAIRAAYRGAYQWLLNTDYFTADSDPNFPRISPQGIEWYRRHLHTGSQELKNQPQDSSTAPDNLTDRVHAATTEDGPDPGGIAPESLPADSNPATTAGSPQENASLSIDLASISDAPTTDDELGFKPYVLALAKFLLSQHTSGPLTLSIEGEWGSGKSSFMMQLEKSLKAPSQESVADGQPPPATRTFWFNAWRQDKQEAVWAAFALAFSRELRSKVAHPWGAGLKLALLRAKVNPDQIGLATASIKAMAWIAGIVFCFATLQSLGAGELKWFLSGTVTMAALVQGFKGLKEVFGSPFETHVTRYLRGPDYAERVAFVDQFHDDFKRMVDIYARNVNKIFVFIDDLDRCEVPKAAELMQAFNLLIGDDKRLVFVIGMDREKVAAGVAAKYKDLAPFLYGPGAADRIDYGFAFLEKFIQLPFQIPTPNVKRLDEFLKKMSILPTKGTTTVPVTPAAESESLPTSSLPNPTQRRIERDLEFNGDSGRVREVAKMVAVTVQRGPRRLKQFVSLFRLKAYIANQLGLFDDGDSGKPKLTFEQLGKFVAISLAWPKLIGELCTDTSLLSKLEEIALSRAVSTKNDPMPAVDPGGSGWTQSRQLTALLQYGCVGSQTWPLEPIRYSLQNVDLAPMLEVSPQVIRDPGKKSTSSGEAVTAKAAASTAPAIDSEEEPRTSPTPRAA